jgi:hypothetical protein
LSIYDRGLITEPLLEHPNECGTRCLSQMTRIWTASVQISVKPMRVQIGGYSRVSQEQE